MNPLSSPLLTDLYQLTMLQAYGDAGMNDVAVFEVFVRKLPRERNFLVAAGLEQVLEYITAFHFSAEELAWIEDSGLFRQGFTDHLANLRFTGEVHAMPEGTIFFPNEPILRVTAPMMEAQILETRVVNLLHLQTLIASKAARCTLAADGRGLVDFGLRRAHGAEAGLYAARASYLAGFTGTATTLAGPMFGIPVFGTMAHSFVQAHADEADAFEHFARSFPDNAVLLVDTYDTAEAARTVVELLPRFVAHGITPKGVRLDSGDLDALSREVRTILDEGGLRDTTIFASGNLDETRIRELVAAGAPIDSFGVGTALVTSSDAPSLDMVYKLEEYAGRPRRKRSTGKATWPGRKQVYRQYAPDGRFERDVVALEGEPQPGEPLLTPVLHGKDRLQPPPTLSQIRERAQAGLARLPDALRLAEHARRPYPVSISPVLRHLAEEVDSMTGAKSGV
ncbi:MAG: nicotinate phosphoribosyltransferase [Betaproteobacteria bacterium]|nr:nicotinate phosphoribosyltransferase [Betaproteobacteria bacterium]